MDTNELKFLLKLLGCENYRSSLSASAFDVFKSDKNKICLSLGDRELIDYTREIASVKILSPGQALLKEPAQVPITDKELKVLEKISKASGKIPPSKITSPKAAERDAILKTLSDRGLIEAEMKIKKAKAEVWLTERGIEYLRDEYSPKGAALSDEEILQTIRMLDRELGTDNYLPIFHLRQKLQPPLSRDELDRLLYRLQGNDQIELSSLQEANAYTPEQVDAGITQNIGGSLFFISVN